MKLINVHLPRILLLLSFTICLNSFGQTPSYEAVLTYMHENIDVNPERGTFKISRRPNGYFLCTNVYDDDQSLKSIDCQQIWSATTASFIKPTFKNHVNYKNNVESDMTSRFSALWASRRSLAPLLYYGYPEWISDTKSFLENKPNLTSKERETLARTYSDEANNYVHPGQYGFNGIGETGYEDAGYSKISTERVNGYKRAYDKCLLTWKEIKENDPSYSPNLITDLDLKIANDYMHGYLTMNCIHEPELANDYLNKAYYPPSFIEYAKNLLDECEQNGILLTNGDSDTYPLWYVQDKLGFRTDVTVINLSLAQTSWYIELLMDRYHLKLSFSPQEIRDNQNKYFVFESEDKIDFKEWVKSYQSGEDIIERLGYKNYVGVVGNWEINLGSTPIAINNKAYAFAYQVFIYDVITSNPDREIFAVTPYSFLELGLQNYYTYTGQLTKLETTLPVKYFTKESESKIINEINNLPKGYFAGFGNLHSFQRSQTLQLATMVFPSHADQIVPIVEKHILSDLSIDKTAPSLAKYIIIFYSKFDEVKRKEYEIKYDAPAVKFVKRFVVHPNSLYDDLEEFYDLVSIYTSMPRYEMISHSEDTIDWHGSKALYNTLKTKLRAIEEECNLHNLKVSSNKISVLMSILNACYVE